jgi:hypothetical protein
VVGEGGGREGVGDGLGEAGAGVGTEEGSGNESGSNWMGPTEGEGEAPNAVKGVCLVP